MKKLFAIAFCLVFSIYYSFAQRAAQGAVMYFEQTAHDFGTVKEEGGPYTHTFKFTNTGSEPVVVSNVKASCGCTTPSWTKDPVLPGKTGTITAAYDSKNRPGKFNKTITVTANTEPASLVLSINGDVTPREKGPADWYPAKIGSLRFESTQFSFGGVKNNESKNKDMKIFNDGKEPVTLSEIPNLPVWLKISFTPATIEPGKEGLMKGVVDGTKKVEWGSEMVRIEIPTNDKEEPKKGLFVNSTLEEFFPPMNEQEKAKAPKVTFDKSSHDFGKVKQGEVVKTTFSITNSGKDDLIIRQTKASCGCTLTKTTKTKLKGGETTQMEVSFNSAGKKGKSSNTVTVICNDSEKSSTVIQINAEVEVPTTAPVEQQVK